jgi:hypothetical protein
MEPQTSAFAALIEAYEKASREYDRLNINQVHLPKYSPDNGLITLESVERLKAELATHASHAAASAEAEQAFQEAKANLDAWFPPQVAASLDEGVAMVAPAADGVIVLVRHQGSYLIERGASQEDALNEIERFLNQF